MIENEDQTILRHPPDCKIQRDEQGGLAISTPKTKAIALDQGLVRLWRMADGVTMNQLDAAATHPYWREAIRTLRLAGLLLPSLERQRDIPSLVDPTPLVSVIIPTRNGRHHLAECLPSLQAQTYPNVEVLVVDDNSTDDTAAYVETYFPAVNWLSLPDGSNFSAACNLGASQAQGDYYFFLNNDTVLDANCILELVASCQEEKSVGGVAALMRLYDYPAFINGLGTQQRRMGFGYDIGLGSLDVGQFDDVDEVPALCFGAALIPREVWQQVGPLDERYQFYYEDADWSYRARLQGLRLIPAPHALVFHKFSASMRERPSAFKIRLATRNRLWYATKNLPGAEALLQMILYWLDDVLRLLRSSVTGRWSEVGAILLGWLGFCRELPGVLRDRWQLSRPQKVNRVELSRPFISPVVGDGTPFLTLEMIATRYRPFLQGAVNDGGQQQLLIISPDAVHSLMGGVGVRYWELAQQLATAADVTLAIPNETDLETNHLALRKYEEGDESSLRPVADSASVILLSGFTVYHHPFLAHSPVHKIVDLYDPMILENLERFANSPIDEQHGMHNVGVKTFNQLLRLGDFFICGSEKQRDYWLGALTAANRVNPAVYAADPGLRRLIDVVPSGLPAEVPQHTQNVLKGAWPGIGREDKVILWGGGLWDWLDPLTVIAAMPTVLQRVPEARLFFLGTRHPNPNVPLSQMSRRSIARAEEMGLKDEVIFFNDWTPYQERVNYLCEADVGVSLHRDHIETRFAVRTRLLDYLWASLPMVVSGGDVLGDLVAKHRLGHLVAAGDQTAVAEALVDLLQNPVNPERFAPIAARFHWSQVATPLKTYVRQPWRNEGSDHTPVSYQPVTTPLRQLPAKALEVLRKRGLGGLAQESVAYLRWIRHR